MKWSNHADTRSPERLAAPDVAEGYIPMALRVMEGKAKLGDDAAERRATLDKARRVLLAAGIKPRIGAAGLRALGERT